ncbi:integrase, catalytic region, zinc finger, CCHC-type containing protein [Tanacetum coccineum]
MDSIILLGQKNSLAEYMILPGADNRPPMLDKYLYDSWKSRMELYMQNRENERMILESVENEKIQADCDMKATNIILQGLLANIYSIVNHHGVAKDLWERVQLLMQVNAKFLNSLPPEWSKFVTDVKIVKDLHTTNFDQLHEYLQQHELHANEVRIMCESNHDPLALVVNHQQTSSYFNTYQSSYNNPQFQQQFSPSKSPHYGSIYPTQHYSSTHPSTPIAISYPSTPYSNAYTSSIDSGLAVPVFKQGDDPIDAINKMMPFLSSIGRQGSVAGTSGTRANISETSSNNSGQQRVVKYFKCQGEGHMARQCPKPKRRRDATWFRDKVILVEAQGNGKVLNEEELEFLVDHGITEGPVKQKFIKHNAAYQAGDLDAYDSDCDDFSTSKVVLMANLSSYGSDVFSEVPHSENTHTDMLNQSVQEMSYSEQIHLVNYPENEITSDSNIIPYSQYLLETQNAAV